MPTKALNGLASTNLKVVSTISSIAFGEESNTPLPSVLALQPWESNERIIAQSGRFTIHNAEAAIETLSFNEEFLVQMTICAGLKRELRETLKALGVRRWNLFPDLDNLAKGLIEDI
jgi:hypothetical protein